MTAKECSDILSIMRNEPLIAVKFWSGRGCLQTSSNVFWACLALEDERSETHFSCHHDIDFLTFAELHIPERKTNRKKNRWKKAKLNFSLNTTGGALVIDLGGQRPSGNWVLLYFHPALGHWNISSLKTTFNVLSTTSQFECYIRLRFSLFFSVSSLYDFCLGERTFGALTRLEAFCPLQLPAFV